jgi:hypothetical protein
MDSNVVNIIISILSGIAACIPLVVQLVKYVKQSVQEKNWNQLLTLVTNLMEEAEKKFATGAERKEWVMSMVKASADTVNYPIDLDVVSELIDSLCAMSKIVNGKSE